MCLSHELRHKNTKMLFTTKFETFFDMDNFIRFFWFNRFIGFQVAQFTGKYISICCKMFLP